MKRQPPRRRTAKRSARGRRQQALSKEARELFRADAGDDEMAEAFADLEAPPARPRAGATRTPAEPAPPADGERGRRGVVVEAYSGGCRVREANGEDHDCALPSALAAAQQEAIAVGDEVRFVAATDDRARVVEVLPRRTVIARPDPHNPRLRRVIAANVDAAVHVSSLRRPSLRPALIDRYLVIIGQGGAEPLLVANKIDLVDDLQTEMRPFRPYLEMGLRVFPCSAETGAGIDELRGALAGRTAVFVGHSGVGKSSLLNALAPAVDASVGAVAAASGKGRHTTTRSSLHRLAGEIHLIDTPGIRELGLGEVGPVELAAAFPDVAAHARGCRFGDCTHAHEPDCAVRAAVAAGDLRAERLAVYQRLLGSVG